MLAWHRASDEQKDLVEYILAEPPAVRVQLELDDWQMAATMHKHQGILALDRLVDGIATEWADRMIYGMLNKRNTVDQREIDERRGWYTGARYALRVLPFRAHRRALKQLAEQQEVED